MLQPYITQVENVKVPIWIEILSFSNKTIISKGFKISSNNKRWKKIFRLVDIFAICIPNAKYIIQFFTSVKEKERTEIISEPGERER